MLEPMDTETNRPLDAATTVEHSPEGNDIAHPLVIDQSLLDRIVIYLATALPNEGCGLLAGILVDSRVRAAHFFPGTNIDHSPVRYTMDPVEVIEAMKRMREEQWMLAAIVHSHPRTRPRPSHTDLREWYYPETRLLIVSFMADEPEIGCWTLANEQPDSAYRPAEILIETR